MAYTTINKSTEHFNTKLFTGTGSAQSITGVGFQPDWVWSKGRNSTNNHTSFDAVRGTGKALYQNLTNAEENQAQGITAFGTDGFSVGTLADINNSGGNIVSWNWKAGGGQGSSNTDGSINTTYTSANTTAGFSISTYTGTGSSATIGHGLGVAPEFIIIKRTSATESWYVQATVLGYSKYLVLNTNAAQANTSGALISSVSSSTITVDGNSAINGSGQTYVMYAFASKTGYSKIGTYTGNGNANGAFIYTGFKPAWMMIKESSNAGNEWYISDGTRSPTNAGTASAKVLAASGNGAEESGQSYNQFDILSNGYKVRGDDTRSNGSGRTYIYMAFGQSLVGSNNVPCTAR